MGKAYFVPVLFLCGAVLLTFGVKIHDLLAGLVLIIVGMGIVAMTLIWCLRESERQDAEKTAKTGTEHLAGHPLLPHEPD